MSINAPCRNCTAREVGCHSICNKYREFKNLTNQRNNDISKAKKLYNEPVDFTLRQMDKTRRSHR